MEVPKRSGFSIVEVMVALLVITVGVLGAGGTLAMAWRAELAGERAAVASRVAGSVLDSLRAVVLYREGSCGGLAGGATAAPHGTLVSWSSSAVPGGREVLLTLVFPSLAAPVADTVWTYIPCR